MSQRKPSWITRAGQSEVIVRDGLAAVAEWESEHGAFTDLEIAEARRRLAADRGDRSRPGRSP